MKTSRKDTIRDKRATRCSNSSWIGFSSGVLRDGDYFVTVDGKLARCHGRVKPSNEHNYYILAQVANVSMQYSMERWITPDDVIEVIPADRCRPEIVAFFDNTEDFFG